MKRLALGLAASTLITGCAVQMASTPLKNAPTSSLGIAQAAARDVLKDPDSAKFKNSYQAYRLENGDLVICGEMNAKNSFGGYVGYEPYYVRLRGNIVKHIAMDDLAAYACNSAAKGSVPVSSD